MADAVCFAKGGTENTVILNVRTDVTQGFQAPHWIDLRIGWCLSVCDDVIGAGDDVITGLAEEIGTPPRPFLPWSDRYAIGITDKATKRIFIGYTNANTPRPFSSMGTSQLVSSDSGIGTTNSNFWRPKNNQSDIRAMFQTIDNDLTLGQAHNGAQIHFAQNTGGAGGYATLLMMRLRRPNHDSKTITVTIKSDPVAHNGDVLYTNTPNDALLRSNLEAFPTNVETIGPDTLSVVPDAFYLYWPFDHSRLRIHEMGFMSRIGG
jgi:hypothetical protein